MADPGDLVVDDVQDSRAVDGEPVITSNDVISTKP
jgi:hypothetical protein